VTKVQTNSGAPTGAAKSSTGFQKTVPLVLKSSTGFYFLHFFEGKHYCF